MSRSDTNGALYVAGLGEFHAQRCDVLGLYCFSRNCLFQSQRVSLIVYPNEDGTWPTADQRQELKSRYQTFRSTVKETLSQLPQKLRPLAADYQIDIHGLSDLKIISGLRWQNVKLEPEGTIECYAINKAVTTALHIVIRFSSPTVISKVHFDG